MTRLLVAATRKVWPSPACSETVSVEGLMAILMGLARLRWRSVAPGNVSQVVVAATTSYVTRPNDLAT